MVYFRAFQGGGGEAGGGVVGGGGDPGGGVFGGEGNTRGVLFGGVSYSRSWENDTGPKGGYETGLLQTDDASDEGDGVEV